jgi:acetylglutamate kinase
MLNTPNNEEKTMEEAIKKADVLIEALAYIKKFRDKIVVIKYGGSILADDKIRRHVLEDIVFLNFTGLKPVLVHGGGPSISERMRKMDKKTEFFEGMRVTDALTLKIVEEELERLNSKIVLELEKLGAKPKGISGKENIIFVRKKSSEIDLGFVGEVVKVNGELIKKFLSKDFIPVISPMGIDEKKLIYNVNADEVAANVAGGLKAEKFILLTNVAGVMRISDEPSSLISSLNCKEINQLIEEKVITEGMIPKVRACLLALEKGVKKTHIIDARIPHALLLEIFTDKGIGTEIIR